jgi:hypothetical protein
VEHPPSHLPAVGWVLRYQFYRGSLGHFSAELSPRGQFPVVLLGRQRHVDIKPVVVLLVARNREDYALQWLELAKVLDGKRDNDGAVLGGRRELVIEAKLLLALGQWDTGCRSSS